MEMAGIISCSNSSASAVPMMHILKKCRTDELRHCGQRRIYDVILRKVAPVAVKIFCIYALHDLPVE